MSLRISSGSSGGDNQPRRHQIIEGATKTLYEGTEPGTHILFFKDETLVRKEKVTVNGKGILNNRISQLFMSRLDDLGIATHFVRNINMREQLVHAAEILPFKITLHNIATGVFAKRLGLEDGMVLSKPIPEFSSHSKELNHPIVTVDHITTLGWGRFEELEDILLISQRVNDFLTGQFLALNIRLISFSLEFGRLYSPDLSESHLVITDELSPETCNLLDVTTGTRLDRYGVLRNGEEVNVYKEVACRLGVLNLDSIEEPASLFSSDFGPYLKPTPNVSLRKKNHNGYNSW